MVDLMRKRIRVIVSGVVQGVGFRPYVYGLASRMGLDGYVRNEPEGVIIELEGAAGAVESFLNHLETAAPPRARIQEVRSSEIDPLGGTGFAIQRSEQTGERNVTIAPDYATCGDCLRELRDPRDRRYRYPFINCTNCGPRYTIIQDVPYDRAKTTMSAFTMCAACRAEYEDPANRRFHAEPTCCPECGPRVWLTDANGTPAGCASPIEETIRRLRAGAIVAIKGLGGFHLACDAGNADAVRRLRERKHRDMKPFALMVKDLEAAERLCEVSPVEARVLMGCERPIVLLKKRATHGLAETIAPRNPRFGAMLPYTPLHELIFEGDFPALVMTSGNLSDEPIAFHNEDALARLRDLADAFLIHDRGIHIRTDDSVVRAIAGVERFLRRSRGYAPFPVHLPVDTRGCAVLATGAELSAAICLTRGHQAFLSHHIGDLENLSAYESFVQAVEHMKSILDVAPASVACDLHPGYASTRFARACGLPIVQVQHHHAHIASVLAETGRTDKVIGVAFDGMGWGDDGTAWGGEFLVCDLAGYERVGHLAVVPQPGADAAAKRPVRMGYVYLREAFGAEAGAIAHELLPDLSDAERSVAATLIERGVNCPMTSSMGRLFDAASALLGICSVNAYHAQAPVELEAQAWFAPDETDHYPAGVAPASRGTYVLSGADIIRAMVLDYRSGTPANVCAARFHNALAHATLEMCGSVRNTCGLSTVVLSGGVFANAFLTERVKALLEEKQFEVLLNASVPAGDGGISLGQAAVAAWRRTCA
jgi:hydrogenase maturation protein HypF